MRLDAVPKGNKIPPNKWLPGESGNPLGVNTDPALKAVRRMNRQQITEVGTLIVECNFAKLKEMFNDPNTSALQMMFISAVIGAIEKKDAYSMAVINEQICGKPVSYVDHSIHMGLPQYKDMTLEQIQEKIKILSEKALQEKTIDV